MFAPLKRIMILAVALMLPGVAFSYVSVDKIYVDNDVPDGSEGFVVSVVATVSAGDTWESSYFNFDNYEEICLDHDDFGPGTYNTVFYVPFEDGEVAGDEGDDDFDFWTYDDDDCGSSNHSTSHNRYVYVDGFEWDDVTGFAVQKAFRPASDLEVQVDINCSAGSPGDDSAMVGDGEIQIFPQEFLNPGNPNHNCVITEADVPAGYRPLYVTNPYEGGGLLSDEGCFFYGSGNMRSTNTCQIINLGLPSTFTLTKNWEVFQDDDAAFVDVDELQVLLGVACSRRVLAGHVADEGMCMDDDADSSYNGCTVTFDDDDSNSSSNFNDAFYWNITGDATMTVTVDNTGAVAANCVGIEEVRYSNHERTATNCLDPNFGFEPIAFELAPGGSAGCGYVNTVFFEGIPTLSQYGMAIMALLMLGVGFVGFRRFV